MNRTHSYKALTIEGIHRLYKNFNSEKAISLIVLVWACLASWHPAYLGFFSDDWALFALDNFTPRSFEAITELYPNYPQILMKMGVSPNIMAARPLYGLILFSLKSFLLDSHIAWQLVSIIMLLGAVYALFLFFNSLAEQLGYSPREFLPGATIAAIIYLIGPWSVVMGSWPTISITLLSQIMVTLGLRTILNTKQFFSVIAVFLLLAGFLIYEAYWGMFIPVAIFLLAAPNWKKIDVFKFLAQVISVLTLAILIKIGLSNWWNVPHKKLLGEFSSLFLSNMQLSDVVQSAIQPVPLWFFWAILIAITSISHYFATFTSRHLLINYVALIVGLSLSALFYALVGYGLTGTGVMSRVMAAQNVYFSIFIGMIFINSLKERATKVSSGIRQSIALYIYLLGFLGLMTVLLIGTAARSDDWVSLWKTELDVLSKFPEHLVITDIMKGNINKPTSIVVQLDEDRRGTIFGAAWEIEGAIAWKYPILKKEIENGRLTFLVGRETEWSTFWNGDQLIQQWCGSHDKIVSTVKAERVKYIRIGRNGSSVYSIYPLNREIGCIE